MTLRTVPDSPAQRGLPPCHDKGGLRFFLRHCDSLSHSILHPIPSLPDAQSHLDAPARLAAPPPPVAAPALPLRASFEPLSPSLHLALRPLFSGNTYEPSREPTLTFGRRPAPAKLHFSSFSLTSLARPLNILEPPTACRSASWSLLLFSRLQPLDLPLALQPPQDSVSTAAYFPPWSLHKERDHSHQILRRLFKLAVIIHPIHRTLAS